MSFTPRAWAVTARLANLFGSAAYIGWGVFHGTPLQYWFAFLGGLAFWAGGIVVALNLDAGALGPTRRGEGGMNEVVRAQRRSPWSLVGVFTVGTFGVVGGIYFLLRS